MTMEMIVVGCKFLIYHRFSILRYQDYSRGIEILFLEQTLFCKPIQKSLTFIQLQQIRYI